jgi:hypothetical protein
VDIEGGEGDDFTHILIQLMMLHMFKGLTLSLSSYLLNSLIPCWVFAVVLHKKL